MPLPLVNFYTQTIQVVNILIKTTVSPVPLFNLLDSNEADRNIYYLKCQTRKYFEKTFLLLLFFLFLYGFSVQLLVETHYRLICPYVRERKRERERERERERDL